MSRYIQKIKTTIPHSKKQVDIEVNGKNLIFTGRNGCGKTRLLEALYQFMSRRIIKRENQTEQQVINNINFRRQWLKECSQADRNFENLKNNLIESEKELKEIQNPAIVLDSLEQFVIRYHNEKSALLLKFEAMRQAAITAPTAAVSKESLRGQERSNNVSCLFEEYLVSHKTSQAYAESSVAPNKNEAETIKTWFDKLQNDLRELFEDKSLTIVFDAEKQAFFIKQKDKDPYRLQDLSSGFSSVLSIYGDLLTRVELRAISPDAIDGVVFIDEIDAHLHVSLQRKILPFLTHAFPNVQFIVTTHSPFVVSSVNDAVIYDLSSLEAVEDLSAYSYDAILEGLFGVSTMSEPLKKQLTELTEETQKEVLDLATIETLISKLRRNEAKLDAESLFFLESAQLTLTKAKANNKNV